MSHMQQNVNSPSTSMPPRPPSLETVAISNPFDEPVPAPRSTVGSCSNGAPFNMAPPPPAYYHLPPNPAPLNHAPPVHYCQHCHQEIKDGETAIQCTAAGQGCNYFYHQSCSGLTVDACNLLLNEPLADWVCDKCNDSKKIDYIRTYTPIENSQPSCPLCTCGYCVNCICNT